MIESWRSRGLKEIWETGSSRRVRPDLIKRIRVRLSAMAAATHLEQLKQPGFDLHKLRGKPERYTVHVNGPWCITFGWDAGKAREVDLEQYH